MPESPDSALKPRKRFTIDSLLEQKLQSGVVSRNSEAAEDDENETASPENGSEEAATPDSGIEKQESEVQPTVPTAQMSFINAFAKLMAASSMQNLMSANNEYATRFRMINLNAMAPSMAAFGQPPFAKLPPFLGPLMRPENPRLPLGGATLNRLVSVGSMSSGRSSCSSSGGASGTTIRSSNVKKYRCDICEKTFSRSNTLITHKRIHTGEKPFRCEHCGRAFRQPGNLTRHRLTHSQEKPFVCNECGKAFNRASNLSTHQRTHMQLSSRLHCGICSKSFAMKAELRSHFCSGKPLLS